MASQENSEKFEDTVATWSTSITSTQTRTDEDADRNTKKRKMGILGNSTISEFNIPRFKVLKKLNIQITRTNHHIAYLKRCERNGMVPKSLRVNLTPQVPVIDSTLQLKWEEAQIGFGLALTRILLEYWTSRQRTINQEIEVVNNLIKQNTEKEEIELMTNIIDRITLNIEKDLSSKKTPKVEKPKL